MVRGRNLPMPTLASTADTRNEVLLLAAEVHAARLEPPRATMTARQAARVLTGLAAWMTRRRHGGSEGMRQVFYALVTHAPAWEGPLFTKLPTSDGRRVDEDIVLLGVMCSSLVPDFGLANVKAAVAFWATETDPEIWKTVAAA